MKLENVMRQLDHKELTAADVATNILSDRMILSVLAHCTAFFAVAYGEYPGIYKN
jgi:hypothetical protein